MQLLAFLLCEIVPVFATLSYSLCTTQSFYYVTAMLLSPLSPLFLILRFTVSLFPRLHQIQVLCAILGLLTTLSLILRHSTYLWLMQTISDHPVFFIL